jgi:hypothetical protein
MPPKDPVVAPIAAHDRLDFPMKTTVGALEVVSPTPPTDSLVFSHAPTSDEVPVREQHQQQHFPPTKPFSLLETATQSSTAALLGKPQQHLQQIPTSFFCLLPRSEETSMEQEESTKIPVFLAFLNKLHGGESQQQQQPFSLLGSTPKTASASVVTTKPTPNFHPKAIIKDPRPHQQQLQQQRKVTQFAPPPLLQKVYPVLSRHDMTPREIQSTWYTEHYLRMKRQVRHEEDDDGLDKCHPDAEASSCSSSTLMLNHTRDLILAGMYIRRARRIVLAEQARQEYYYLHEDNGNNINSSKEERIRRAYHQVTSYCSREAKERGEVAAKLAAEL